MFSLARTVTLWSAALLAIRLSRSRLFSVDGYLRSNPDLQKIIRFPTFHFCRHGRFEQRKIGQAPFQTWLLPRVLDKKLSPKLARKALHEYTHAKNKQNQIAIIDCLSNRYGLSSELLHFYVADASQDFPLAAQYLSKTPINEAFLHHYDYARKHFLLEPLQEAYEYASKRIETESFKRIEEIVATQSIEILLEHPGTDRASFSRLVLENVSQLEANSAKEKFRQFWQVGLPILNDGSPIANQLLSQLSKRVRQQLSNARDETPTSCSTWETMINLQTANMLNNQQLILSKTGEISTLSHDIIEDTIRFRMLGEGYWRLAERDPLFKSIVDASRTVLETALEVYDYVLPDYGMQIFDIRGQSDIGLPTLSYHTITRPEQRYLNYKESALPDFFSIDTCGYSGWSSTQETGTLSANQLDAEKFFQELASEMVQTQRSKYTESSTSTELPNAPFVLVALQVPDDTVAQHACLSRTEILQTVCEYYRDTEIDVLVKIHPHDRSEFTAAMVDDFCYRFKNVRRASGPIHPILENAKLVVTVNSGAGFEALLHEKPVISTGLSEYTPCTLFASNTTELIKALFNSEKTANSAEHTRYIQRFIYSFLHSRCFKIDESALSLKQKIQMMKMGT